MGKKLVMCVVMVMLTVCMRVPVWGRDHGRISDRDWYRSTYKINSVLDVTKTVIRKVSRGKIKSGKVIRIKGYKVFYIKTYKDQLKFWRLLETRKHSDKYIEVTEGQVLNIRGDGTSHYGTYIGYRDSGVPNPCYYKPGSMVISTFVYSNTNQYTDSIVYRRDRVVK